MVPAPSLGRVPRRDRVRAACDDSALRHDARADRKQTVTNSPLSLQTTLTPLFSQVPVSFWLPVRSPGPTATLRLAGRGRVGAGSGPGRAGRAARPGPVGVRAACGCCPARVPPVGPLPGGAPRG